MRPRQFPALPCSSAIVDTWSSLFGQPLKVNCRDVGGDYYQYGSDGAGDHGCDDGDGGDDDAVKEVDRHVGHDGGDVEGSETALMIPRLPGYSHRTRYHFPLMFGLTTMFHLW